jgi:hypothetical protein
VLGKYSVSFLTNPQGGVDKAVMSLDEAEVAFARRPDAVMSDPEAQALLAGTYENATGAKFQVVTREGGRLARVSATGAETLLEPVKPWVYRVKAFADVRYEFVLEDGRVKALKVINPSGEFVSVRKWPRSDLPTFSASRRAMRTRRRWRAGEIRLR